jgi:hypothetical protein
MDLIYLATTVVFFGLLAGLAIGCASLGGAIGYAR